MANSCLWSMRFATAYRAGIQRTNFMQKEAHLAERVGALASALRCEPRPLRRLSSLLTLIRDAANTADQTYALQSTNQISGQIDLVPLQAVEGRLRERMMVIVPPLAKAEQADEPFVAALVVGVEGPSTELVTDRVNRPRNVVRKAYPYQTTPDQAAPAIDHERNNEAEDNPNGEGRVDHPGDRILQEMFGVPFGEPGSSILKHPTYMGVKQSLKRTVRVSRFVGQAMMFPVSGDPLRNLALDSHRSESKEYELDRRMALEATVGGESVEAHGNAEARQQVEAH
jgi:hypothetical protein